MKYLESILDNKSYEKMTRKELLKIIYNHFITFDDVHFKTTFLYIVKDILFSYPVSYKSVSWCAKHRMFEHNPDFDDIYFIPTKKQIMSYTDKEIEDLLESVNDDDTVYCSIDDLRAQVYYRRVVTHELVKRFRNK